MLFANSTWHSHDFIQGKQFHELWCRLNIKWIRHLSWEHLTTQTCSGLQAIPQRIMLIFKTTRIDRRFLPLTQHRLELNIHGTFVQLTSDIQVLSLVYQTRQFLPLQKENNRNSIYLCNLFIMLAVWRDVSFNDATNPSNHNKNLQLKKVQE